MNLEEDAQQQLLQQQQLQQQQHQEQLHRLIVASQGRKVRINQVRVEGIKYTQPSLVQTIIAPLLHADTDVDLDAATGDKVALGELIERTRRVGARLARLGIFNGVSVELDDASCTPNYMAGLADKNTDKNKRMDKDAVDVIYTVEEASRVWAKTGTDVGNNEGSMFATLKLRNMFGGAESLTGNLSYGVETSIPLLSQPDRSTQCTTSTTPSALGSNQTSTSFQLLYTAPVNADPDHRLELHASKFHRNMALYSSHAEAVTGLGARFKLFNTIFGAHDIGYDVAWRHIFGLAKDASYTIRKDAGHTLKSAISYSMTLDRRNDTLLPTQGHFFKGFMELAGIGGDVLHAKAEVDSQVHVPLKLGFSASGSARGGILFPLAHDRPNRVNDRFFLGGPQSVRGFQQHGVGPQDGVDRVGGDLFFSSGLSLFTPLPFLINAPIKGHLFANFGSLVQMDQDEPVTQAVRRLFFFRDRDASLAVPDISADPVGVVGGNNNSDNSVSSASHSGLFGGFSSSVGLGLAVRFSMLRLELNYCLPVTVCATDRVKPGFQFGVGLNFS